MPLPVRKCICQRSCYPASLLPGRILEQSSFVAVGRGFHGYIATIPVFEHIGWAAIFLIGRILLGLRLIGDHIGGRGIIAALYCLFVLAFQEAGKERLT